MTQPVELFPASQVSVNPYSNAKGTHKLIIRVDTQLAERLVVDRDPEELQRFLDTVQHGGN